MNYIEIAKYVNFTFEKYLMKKVIELNDECNEQNLSLKPLKNYDLNPALIEMHKNFTENWRNERIVSQLNKDYQYYLDTLMYFTWPETEDDRDVFKANFKRLKDNLSRPTVLDIDLVDSFFPKNDEQQDFLKGPNFIWFKIGLKFAKGEIPTDALLKKSAPEIAKEVGLPEGEKYILGTLNRYDTDKNIYNSEKKMTLIYEYCKMKKIHVAKDFKANLNSLTTDF